MTSIGIKDNEMERTSSQLYFKLGDKVRLTKCNNTPELTLKAGIIVGRNVQDFEGYEPLYYVVDFGWALGRYNVSCSNLKLVKS